MKHISPTIALLVLTIGFFACTKKTDHAKVIEKYHKSTLLIDHFGITSCLYEGEKGEDIVFSYHYQNTDSSRVIAQIVDQINLFDSIYDSLYFDQSNIYILDYQGRGEDSLHIYDEYRIKHRGSPQKKVTVMYRQSEKEAEHVRGKWWYDRLLECHRSDN